LLWESKRQDIKKKEEKGFSLLFKKDLLIPPKGGGGRGVRGTLIANQKQGKRKFFYLSLGEKVLTGATGLDMSSFS